MQSASIKKSSRSLLVPFSAIAVYGLSALPAANAAVIAEYTFPLVSGVVSQPTTATATTVASGVTTSLFGGVGVGFSAGVADSGSDSDLGNVFLNRANTGESKSESHYFSFTVTPDSGKSLNLTSLDFYYGDAQGEASPTVLNLGLYTSVDTYASQVGSILAWSPSVTIAPTYFTTASGAQYASIDLTGAPFQGLTTATTFRIYGWDNTNVGGQLRIDDVRLNGTVVPEPSASALGMLALAGLTRRRRR